MPVAEKKPELETRELDAVKRRAGPCLARPERPSSCPSPPRAYLYLSGTPFKALATGEFIEEQIFNWTYTDEQRAKAAFAAAHPTQRNPYGALPQMRLLTYQVPDELLAVASGGELDEFDLNAFFEASGSGARGAVQAQKRCAKVARHHSGRPYSTVCRAAESRLAATVPVFRCAAAALLAAFVLVFAQRGRLPCDGQFAGRKAKYVSGMGTK